MLPQRPVMLTFDDAYQDFLDHAFPLLQRYGMSSELFVIAGKVGCTADWDRAYGPPASLAGWDAILRLERSGIVHIGSHMLTHRPSTSLNDEELVREAAVSRFMLEARFGRPVTSMALPYGDYNRRVVKAVDLCGYQSVYTCVDGVASTRSDPLQIPRLEVRGDTDLSSFARMLGLSHVREEPVPA